MVKVAIVEDNKTTREGLETIINLSEEYRCVCACATAEDALQQLPPHQPHHNAPRPQPPSANEGGNVDRLPSFITGGGPQPHQAQPPHPQQGQGQNGHDNQPDRFPLHRRRRRHRGPRHDIQGGSQGGDGGGD